MHNNDIGTLCTMMTSATFKSLYGKATKRLKLQQIRKKVQIKMICFITLLYWSLFEGFLGWFEAV